MNFMKRSPARRQTVKNTANLKFRCPICLSNLLLVDLGDMKCDSCQSIYPYRDGKWWMNGLSTVVTEDSVDSLKHTIRQRKLLYRFLVVFLSPVFPLWGMKLRSMTRELTSESIVLDLGCGNDLSLDRAIGVDVQAYPAVDIVIAPGPLPIADSSVDMVTSIAVLEHVQEPALMVAEIHRVLRTGGDLVAFIPFIQGFHAAPDDFQRYTKNGLRHLFRDFEIEELLPVGPTSGLIWVFAEWIGSVLSFGSSRLQAVLTLLLQATLSPLKWADAVLRFAPGAENVTSGYIVKAKKPLKAIENNLTGRTI